MTEKKFLPFLHLDEKFDPLHNSDLRDMAFELAMLHGEMHRIYTTIENIRCKRGFNTSLSEEVGTSGDRMVQGILRVAAASMDYLRLVVDFYEKEDGPGVFVYDHIEVAKARKWKQSNSLAAELWRELPEDAWLQAAENNVVNLNELNFVIHYWAEAQVPGFALWYALESEDEQNTQLRHSGHIKLFREPGSEMRGLEFDGGAKYQWDAEKIYCQRYDCGQATWEDMYEHKEAHPTDALIAQIILTRVGLKPVPTEEPAPAERHVPDSEMTAEQLDDKYNQDGDGEHPDYNRQLWRQAVVEMDTNTGYWDWVAHQLKEVTESAGKVVYVEYSSVEPKTYVELRQMGPGKFEVNRYNKGQLSYHYPNLTADSAAPELGRELISLCVYDGAIGLG